MFALATFLAQYQILAVPVGLVISWMCATEAQRRALIAAAVAGVVGLAINQAIGWVLQHPRPFVMGSVTSILRMPPIAHSPATT